MGVACLLSNNGRACRYVNRILAAGTTAVATGAGAAGFTLRKAILSLAERDSFDDNPPA